MSEIRESIPPRFRSLQQGEEVRINNQIWYIAHDMPASDDDGDIMLINKPVSEGDIRITITRADDIRTLTIKRSAILNSGLH